MAVLNPSILDLISVVGGIFVAFLVYILPLLLFRKATAFKHYAKSPETWLVALVGLIIIGVTIYQMVTG